MDFRFELLHMDEATGYVQFVLHPDPERYEWVEHDGERMLFDRMDRSFYPEQVLAELAQQVSGLPMTFAPPRIRDSAEYVRARRSVIRDRLAGTGGTQDDLGDPSAELLASLADRCLNFTVVSFDLVGSTRLASLIPPADFARLISALATEAGKVVPLFRGHVLKYTGDGILAYFPGPTQNTQNDLAIDCAVALNLLVYEALNPEFVAAGLPAVDVRIGLDHGEAAVLVLGASETKRHADLIGEVVSLACKIERLAAPGEICIGGIAERAIHTHWRKMLEPVELPSDWPYQDEHGKPYPVARMRVERDGLAFAPVLTTG